MSSGIPEVIPIEHGPLPMRTYHRAPSGKLLQRVEDYYPTTDDNVWMELALDLAEEAGENGDNAVGSVLVAPGDRVFGTQTREFRDGNLLGHAEILAYNLAQPEIGRDLRQCRLYCSAEPCHQCAGLYDVGRIGMLFVATKKVEAPKFFRKPNTLNHIWKTTRRELIVVEGLKRARGVVILEKYAKKH